MENIGIDNNRDNDFDAPADRWTSSSGLFWTTSDTFDSLPSGLFRTTERYGIGKCLEKMNIHTDDLIKFPDLICNEIIDQVDHFWKDETRKRMKELGFLHKRGLMMYGPPGCGKTCTIQMIISSIMEDNGLVIYSSYAGDLIHWLSTIRKLEPERKIIVLLEDFDTLVLNDENSWLALLDGEYQVDGIVYLATTNYIENFDKRFINRPSRFDLIISVDKLSASSRRIYFKHKLPNIDENTLKEYIEMTNGFQVAHLREFIVATECFGKTPKQAEEQLRGQMKLASDEPELQLIESGSTDIDLVDEHDDVSPARKKRLRRRKSRSYGGSSGG